MSHFKVYVAHLLTFLSGSMEPSFQRGDLLFLYQSDGPFRVGEVVVFKIDGRDIPIVHRVLEVHEKYGFRNLFGFLQFIDKLNRVDGTVDMLTKGDNNDAHDRGLYNGLTWLQRQHVMGRAAGYVWIKSSKKFDFCSLFVSFLMWA